ncbi:hypothetical protein [Rhodococcoides yunnanense]|uniref:hypothetical protein n=1 Tax=Rhodococcoides yunnanense TaxID=278209 RepID=UPI0022B0BDDD|nr:hypothetical protein [Rhodococcus yunnanensis]MCZ4277411.1 hypothetical protein [Rhodococcus yunnanensis]
MSTAAALSVGVHAWGALVAQSDAVLPPPIIQSDVTPILHALILAIAGVSAVAVLGSAVLTVTFRGTWKESVQHGPAGLLIGSIVILLVSVAVVTLLDSGT